MPFSFLRTAVVRFWLFLLSEMNRMAFHYPEIVYRGIIWSLKVGKNFVENFLNEMISAVNKNKAR